MAVTPAVPTASRGKLPVSLRIVAILWGLLSGFLALGWFLELSMAGFPDGYITPYDRQTSLPLTILAWACLAQSLYFIVRGIMGRRIRPHVLLLQLAIALILIVAPAKLVQECPGSSICSSAYQAITGAPIDDGAGG